MTIQKKIAALTGVLFLLIAVSSEQTDAQDYRLTKGNPAFAEVIDDPNLPRVLIIGDSISIGYTVPLREELQGKVNVHRIPTNGGPTTRGLESIDAWIGDSKWDLIHFNWGLHDLKYMNKAGKLVDISEGKQQVSICDYAENLTKLVERLKKTNAKLVWRNTTPVPEGSRGRIKGDELKYNAVAARIMEKHDIPTDDLHTYATEHMKEIQLPKNVHFTKDGSKKLGELVAKKILEELAKKE